VRQQNTIAGEFRCEGVALHCGEPVRLCIRPAPPGSGIVFEVADANGVGEIPALAASVSATANATTLSRDGFEVSTVEHLLASLHALRIDNLRVVLDAAELPALDGSAAPFVRLLSEAGIEPQELRQAPLRVLRRISVEDGERRISIEPGEGLSIDYAIDFAHPAIGRQELTIAELTPEVFEREIAPARTFGFLADLDALRSAGLARGASHDNTLVLGADAVVRPESMRWPDEFVRHKVLDLIGDLSLIGHPIEGHVRVERGGHALHHRLVRALLETPDAWRIEGDEGVGKRAPSRASLLAQSS
jgi:UDP-3-O-[3-hydroxymyristoyl] N-acetylglucosamine deacetylase